MGFREDWVLCADFLKFPSHFSDIHVAYADARYVLAKAGLSENLTFFKNLAVHNLGFLKILKCAL